MISLFRKHGEFCACHPLEVVVGTVTIISSLLSMASSQQMDNEKVCGWNYECAKSQNLSRSDVIMLSFARCVALVYVYMQFRSLRRIGAKHLLGISGVFTIVSSFIFCIAFVMMFGNTMSGLYEALPFFLFLIDLSKASALAAFALSATSREEIRANIGYGMELLGPSITLDAIVETLAIGLGTISGVQQLETMCSFGCLSAVANYVAFMTFYPACLSLVLELSLDLNARTSVQEYKHLVEELKHEHEMKKPNPVIKRVKIIMSLGLAVVHVHSRLATKHIVTGTTELSGLHVEYREPEMSIWQFYLYRLFAVHVDYGMTLILGLVLLVKYVFVDRHTDLLDIKHSMELHRSLSSTVAGTQTDDYTIQDKGDNSVGTHFLVGDDSDDEPTAPDMEDKSAQTTTLHNLSPLKRLISDLAPRTREECVQILKSENGAQLLTDEEVKLLVTSRDIPAYKLEGTLGDYERGVSIRRQIISEKIPVQDALDYLPFSDYDYTFVDGACCENVIGYMPVPVGVAGPLLLDGQSYMVPMATTEGTLVASTNRGCRALSQGGGVHSAILADGMSRGPVVRFPTAMKASKVKLWLEDKDNLDLVKDMFDSTSSYARLQKLQVIQAGRCLYIRFVAVTGDAMGMNMLSKGTEKVLHSLQERFPDLEIVSLSGNICTDKKPAAINWIEGRGKSVVCEAVIPAKVVQDTLKTSVQALVDLNISKNLVGSAMAGSMGGFNAHAANIVTALFIATGQDPAQNVASSNCITLVEATGEHNKDLYISCTMPSLEVGTVGGGTVLPPQAACLKMLGVCGSSGEPGKNAKQLARIVCATVLAGELSLLSALAAGHLVRAHLRHNRSTLACKTSMEEDASRLCHSTSDLTALQSSLKTTPRPVIDQVLQSSVDEKRKTSVNQRSRVVHSLPGQPDMTKTAASHNLSHLPQLSTDGNVLSQLPPLSADGSMITSTSKGVDSDEIQKLDSTAVKQTDSALRHRHLKDKPPSTDNSNIGTCIKHVS